MCYSCMRVYKDFTWEPALEPPTEEESHLDDLDIDLFLSEYEDQDDFERYGYGY